MKAKYNIKKVAQKMEIAEQALRVAIQLGKVNFAFYTRQRNKEKGCYHFIPHLTAQALGEEEKK